MATSTGNMDTYGKIRETNGRLTLSKKAEHVDDVPQETWSSNVIN
jgi:hypothetical protein